MIYKVIYKQKYSNIFPFPNSIDYLEPVVSAKVNDLHYNSHFKNYVEKVSKIIDSIEDGEKYKTMALQDMVQVTYGKYDLLSLYNNSAQVLNHILFWSCLSARKEVGQPYGHFAELMKRCGKSWETLKENLVEEGCNLFGNGWLWVVLKKDGTLEVMASCNAFNPLSIGAVDCILIAIDIWEHAYYIDYTFNRRDYIINLVSHCINWDYVNSILSAHIV